MQKRPEVDTFINDAKQWNKELAALREIILDCGLSEDWKWRAPCYTVNGGNVAIIGGFKDFCTLSFFKGALLKDAEQLLDRAGENTQAARIFRFTSLDEITRLEATIKAYILEAAENEKAGLKFEYKKTQDPLPDELLSVFNEKPEFQKAFEALTPGRQRAYILHFSSAKQSNTRLNRIEKFIPRIMDGIGMNDCTCGHSKKMPACDGSHKFYK